MKNYDVVVVGCGGMGSAISHQLAASGVRVLTLERFSLNHEKGSSHGRSRIIRTAYHEHPAYVSLVRRALALWKGLQKRTGSRLLRMTGGIAVGPPDGYLVKGALLGAREHGLEYEVLGPSEIHGRFHAFNPAEEDVGVYENNAGVLLPEACIEACVECAIDAGAAIHANERVTRWEANSTGVNVSTPEGVYSAEKLVFAAGAWVTQLLKDLRLPLSCERQAVFWLEPVGRPSLFKPDKMPIFLWQEDEERMFYGVPNFGDGVKVARHHGGEVVGPDEVRRKVTKKDERPVRKFLKEHIPLANGLVESSMTCIYTNAPDGHFVIDFHPRHRNVLIVSPCSGHGFKFSIVVGEIVRDMLGRGRSAFDLSLFSLARFRKGVG